jgi:hypothetical protein
VPHNSTIKPVGSFNHLVGAGEDCSHNHEPKPPNKEAANRTAGEWTGRRPDSGIAQAKNASSRFVTWVACQPRVRSGSLPERSSGDNFIKAASWSLSTIQEFVAELLVDQNVSYRLDPTRLFSSSSARVLPPTGFALWELRSCDLLVEADPGERPASFLRACRLG